MRRGVAGLAVAAGLALAAGACGDDPVVPRLTPTEVAGVYGLAELSFDPRGVLEPVDIQARLGDEIEPRLVLGTNGVAQLTFQDPETLLQVTVEGSFTTGTDAVRLDWTGDPDFRLFLLAQQMTFDFTDGVLTFAGQTTDGVDRGRLLDLVPEWQDEQLLDPVPGDLLVTFQRVSA